MHVYYLFGEMKGNSTLLMFTFAFAFRNPVFIAISNSVRMNLIFVSGNERDGHLLRSTIHMKDHT